MRGREEGEDNISIDGLTVKNKSARDFFYMYLFFGCSGRHTILSGLC